MSSYSGIPLAAAAVTPPGGLLAPVALAPPVSKPLTPSATPIRPQPLAPTPAPPPAKPLAAPPVKQTPGSGQQMFQQMFALLKQMLPVEQYAQLHSEMRKGNGNDIKSIVDIIKRIAGDAIFSSVIQKMDLTRTFPTTNAPGAFTAVKPEPGAAGLPTTTSPGSMGRPLAARTMGMTPASTVATTSPKVTAIAPNNRPIAAAPVAMPASIAAQVTTPIHPPLGAISTPPANIVAAGVKPEPTMTAVNSLSPNAASAVAQSRNEALEKIMFAKRLLSHAATCSLAHGVCQVKKCDDVRRVFKHSLSCGGANGCSHCEQLKGLVKYHAKECGVGVTDHCSIPFCDGLRRTYTQNQAALAAKVKAAGIRRGSGSDDDDDNTPLSSAVNKAKKHAKAKSPKSAAGRGPGAHPLKRKGSNASLTRANSSSPGPSSAVSTPNVTATTATMSASTLAAAKPQQKNVTANMTQEYGRLLQLILHVEKCTTSACPVGEECAESKTIMKQMNSPNAPARARTYKQVYGHYKTCVAKNNTGNCPMCKIGLLPMLPAASPTPSPLPQVAKASVPTVNTITPAVTSSPSGGLNKRNSNAVSPTPRSPLKKPRTNSTSRGKVTAAELAAQSAAASDLVSQELAQASVADIRKEADVLTHTNIELGTERRTMMEGAVRRVRMAERLPCQKEEWVEKDLFNSEKLRTQMREIGRRSGVELGGQTSEVMAYALHEYLKQVVEEMVEVSKQRGDSQAQSLEVLQKAQRIGAMMDRRTGGHMELTATDILRVSCEDSFTKLRQEDLALRSQLLEDAKREEQLEKERAKKRKKVDRSKLNQDERDEAEMDVEELAVKDLKERLLQQDKSGVVKVDGRVNESISAKYTPREVDNQVTMEDANYWLLSQKPYIRPKLFVRAEAARIVTKSLL
ncbi:hypothetical protein PHYPSEUDO_005727 [Phytophthora pseudosyringae]|uniref:histone acetyltransferase n=1 Tax=Phytophthora pseudosyringae TaxID=221518 RepID=A0A8T1VNN8_9STRA|nr:hypothetical protein PHYPSEUDO_005727 [Phytophthora pseudosyringae]